MSSQDRRWGSSFGPAVVVAAVLLASLVRWGLQASGNLYTTLGKRFYVPDADLGWRVAAQHPIWLGLDVCAALLALALGLAAAGVVLRRRERRQGASTSPLRTASWAIAAASLDIPVAAFASGAGLLDAHDTLPPSEAVLAEDGIDGSLDAPGGTYAVVSHAGTAVTARLSAGGEAFDARFAGIEGSWSGTPRDLRQTMHAEISVSAASVDTGVGERSKHAREGYLHADQFPLIRVTFDRVAAVRAMGTDKLAFRAPGVASLMGRTHSIEIAGTVAKLDAPALARLGLSGDVLIVQADFALTIHETALARNAHDFDGDRIPVHVTLVLRHAGA